MIVSVPITLKEEDRLNRVEKNLKIVSGCVFLELSLPFKIYS